MFPENNDDSLNAGISTLLWNDDDESSLVADATLQTSACVSQRDLAPSNEEMRTLFGRDGPQCLPPVNIGAEAFNLWKDPLTELERLAPENEIHDPPEPGFDPENPEPQIPLTSPLDPLDDEETDEDKFWREMDEQGWVPYEGDVYDAGETPPVEEPIVEEEDEDGMGIFIFNKDDPCSSFLDLGYRFNLCCDGPTQPNDSPGIANYAVVFECETCKLLQMIFKFDFEFMSLKLRELFCSQRFPMSKRLSCVL